MDIKMVKQKLWILFATILMISSHGVLAQTVPDRQLPKISITGVQGAMSKEDSVEATFTVTYRSEETAAQKEDCYRCLVSYRGATSIRLDKKSMKIVFLQDDGDEERDVNLPGLGRKVDKCNLDAVSMDRSHMRNRLAMDLFNSFSRLPYPTAYDGRHGIEGNFVEVWVEGSYCGLYCLTDRVNRKLLGGKKMKNGVIRGIVYKCMSYDKGCYLLSDGTEPADGISLWNAWDVKYPNEYPSSVFSPLRQLLDAAWDTASDDEFNDLVRRHFYWDNLVDVYLLSIVVGLGDAGYKNSYLSCPDYTADERFVITPWDMDHSFGQSYRGVPLIDPSTLKGQTNWMNTRPYKRLMANGESGFLTSLADRWAELREGPLSVETVARLIHGYADLLDLTGAWQRDRELWNYNPVTLGATAQDEAEYITEWYQSNHDALDELLLPHQSTDITSVQGEGGLTNGYYTLSGQRINGQRLLQKGIYIYGNKKIIVK